MQSAAEAQALRDLWAAGEGTEEDRRRVLALLPIPSNEHASDAFEEQLVLSVSSLKKWAFARKGDLSVQRAFACIARLSNLEANTIHRLQDIQSHTSTPAVNNKL